MESEQDEGLKLIEKMNQFKWDHTVKEFLSILNRKEMAEFNRILGEYKLSQLLHFLENNHA